MKNLKKMMLICSVLILGIIACFGNVFNLQTLTASAETSALTLHEKTKYNSKQEYINDSNNQPTITVLTHGYDSNASHWSNNSSSDGQLGYNSNSLIAKICAKTSNNISLYLARGLGATSFDLEKLNLTNYNDKISVPMLDDVSKHILIVYDSSISRESHNAVYNEFHNILDSISLQYKNLTGVLPRFNLVGHSRGGITNLMYATEHPYNVAAIYSMGTPYNGSVLGGIDYVLKVMAGDDDGNIHQGAQDIMNKELNVSLRNAWNAAFTADVDMNVVALGAMTSLDLISSIAAECKEITGYEAISDYCNLLDTVINTVNEFPNLTSAALTFVKGLAEVANVFGINLYDAVLSKVNEKLSGNVTVEEGRTILGLFNVINDQPLIMDDLFIDTNSQLGYGFDDGIPYNGFKRYVKIFTSGDLTADRAVRNMPGVGHNLEPFNATYTNLISSSLTFAVKPSNTIDLTDDSSGSINLNYGQSFSFSPEYSGERVFTVSDSADINLYGYNSVGQWGLLSPGENNSLTYNYSSDEEYLILVTSDVEKSTSFSFSVKTIYNVGVSGINISGDDKLVSGIKVAQSGYYVINLSSSSISIEDDDVVRYTPNKYYVYLTGGVKELLHFVNNTGNNISLEITISSPNDIEEDSAITVCNDKKILKFVNPYKYYISYQLVIKPNSHGEISNALIYSMTNSNIGTLTTSNTEYIYSFGLSARSTCYIIYLNTDENYQSYVRANPTQLKWLIDGEVQSEETMLPRGADYGIELVLMSGQTEIANYSNFIEPSASWHHYNNGRIYISDDAAIGNSFSIWSGMYSDFPITIICGMKKSDFSFSVSNLDKITIDWTTVESPTYVVFQISSISNNITQTRYSLSNSLDITGYIPKSVGNVTIKLVSVKMRDITFNNNTKYLQANSISINKLFYGGSGTSASPYTIKCTRHLDNVRYATSSHYKVVSSIEITEANWTPISAFYGVFDGGYCEISNLTISISLNSTGNMYYGLFSYCYGTIKNIRLYDPIITNPGNNPTYFNMVGCIVGNVHSGGLIYNCDVYNATMNFKYAYRDQIGIIAGQNHGTIDLSYANNATFATCCFTGGTVGFNCGTVTRCNVTGRIDVLWESENKGFGGIAGYSRGSISSCNFGGHIEFDSPQDGRKICPMLGYIIGWNKGGTYSDNTKYGASFHYHYYYGSNYDQSKYFFKVDDGKIGYDGD